MAMLGLPIPPAYVTTVGDSGLDELALRPQIATLLEGPFAGISMAVRSSSSDEDRPVGNAAGVYDSYLNLTSVEEVLKAMQMCVDSVRSADAVAYRRMRGLSGPVRMSILIQRLVPCSMSGVLYTRNPISERGTMLVEATDGLGTAVVAGSGAAHRFTLQRRTNWRPPQDFAFRDMDELREVLVALGHLLEETMGAPQDIEWGVHAGRLYVLQSRDASPSPIRFPLPANRPRFSTGQPVEILSAGYALHIAPPIGPFATARRESVPTASELEQIALASALLVARGTVCSHAAAACREIGLPVVAVPENFEMPSPALIDAMTGIITPLDGLDPVERKKAIFAASRQIAQRSLAGVRAENKYETVVFDAAAQGKLHRWIRSAHPGALRQVRQTIHPYDDPQRTYSGVSARIQVTDGAVRVQMKRANLLPDRPFRYDEEILFNVDSVGEGDALLRAICYVPFETQQRDLELANVDGVQFSFNHWPGAPQPWVGIEAPSVELASSVIASAGVSAEECAALDGRDLFARLSLPLSGLSFKGNE